MYRELSQTPRNLYQDFLKYFDDGDNRKDYGRVAFHPWPSEEANQAWTAQ